MKDIINGMLYNTETADLVADNKYWDGSNWDRNGRSSSLYRTKKGNFFLFHETRWQGERDRIQPVSKEEAMEAYEMLPEWKIDYQEAFGIEPEEA